MKKVFFVFTCLHFLFLKADAQRLSQAEYINLYKDMAMREMMRTGVPASITLAQGILESESGNSPLVQRSNNHFGIKCKSNWEGPSVSHDDDEIGECFRAYLSAEESYKDHSDFLRAGPRYAALFTLEPTDYKGWAYGLKKAGYATNPKYPDLLIKFIESLDLSQYDIMALEGGKTMFASTGGQKPPVILKAPKEEEPVAIVQPAAFTGIEPFSKVTINRSAAMFVPGGTSLLAVATKYKIKLSRLLQWNDLQKDGILEKDQYIFLEKKQNAGEIGFCYSQHGESLYDISQKYGVWLKNIMEFNELNSPSALSPGTKIFLKPNGIAHSQVENQQTDRSLTISR